MSASGAVERVGLILAEADDDVARWIYERLRGRLVSTELVTSDALCIGARFRHTVTQEDARFDITLADNRRLQTDQIAWVLNRLVRIPDAFLLSAAEDESSYAEQEWRALLCSVLQSLRFTAVVVEQPNPYALTGKWRSPAEWTLLAARAGLQVMSWRWHEMIPQWWPSGAPIEWVLVVGESVFSDAALSPETTRACRRLAELANMSVLQIAMTRRADGGSAFGGVQPIPDLRLGGDATLDALLSVLAA